MKISLIENHLDFSSKKFINYILNITSTEYFSRKNLAVLAGVLSVAPWAARSKFIEGVDRPLPLIHLINGGEGALKIMSHRG
jgi:hypothetical protein